MTEKTFTRVEKLFLRIHTVVHTSRIILCTTMYTQAARVHYKIMTAYPPPLRSQLKNTTKQYVIMKYIMYSACFKRLFFLSFFSSLDDATAAAAEVAATLYYKYTRS